MGDLGDRLKVRDVVAGVSNGLHINGLGTVIDGGCNVLWLIALNEFGVDTKTRELDLKLIVGTTVQVARRHDVVTGVSKSGDGQQLRSLSGGGRNGSYATLERRNTLFKDIYRGLRGCQHACNVMGHSLGLTGKSTHVHNPTVDVSEFFEAKEPRTVGGVIENEGLRHDRK